MEPSPKYLHLYVFDGGYTAIVQIRPNETPECAAAREARDATAWRRMTWHQHVTPGHSWRVLDATNIVDALAESSKLPNP